MNEIKEKYLPVGTVVLLKNGKKRVMVTGFCVTPEGKDEAFDYSGCLYPEGFLSSNQNCLFNHSQIEKVFHMGLIDDEEIKFKEQLKSLIEMADQFSKFKNTDSNNNQQSSNENVVDETSEVLVEKTNNEITDISSEDVNNEAEIVNENIEESNSEIETLDDFMN